MRVRSYFIIAFCLFADVERRETSVKIVADVVRKRVMGVSESLINSNHIGKRREKAGQQIVKSSHFITTTKKIDRLFFFFRHEVV